MLGKLLKYEVKATARTFVPFYLAVILFGLINRFFMGLEIAGSAQGIIRLFEGIFYGAYALTIIATMVLTLFIILQRFYKNLVGDEGYLMFTLPVKTSQNILAKLLVASMWIVVSVVVVLLSLGIMLASKEMLGQMGKAVEDIHSLMAQMGLNEPLIGVLLIIAAVESVVVGVLILYASISIGQLFGGHKQLASFGAFFVLQIATQTVGVMVMGAAYVAAPAAFTNPSSTFFYLFIISQTVLQLLLGVGCYIVTERILSRRLNLE